MYIKFFSNYDTPEGLLKRFRANYAINDQDLSFTIGDDYDYAVVFNGTHELISPTARVITVVQEPSTSDIFRDARFLTGSDYLLIHDARAFEEKLDLRLGGEVIECPTYSFYHDPVEHSFFHYAGGARKLKKLSIIVSYPNKPLAVNEKRLAFLNQLLGSDLDIDIYGWNMTREDRRSMGPLDYKFNGLIPYEYSIVMECAEEHNYITDNFIDCILCNTIPIYHGAPNVNDVYDERYIKTINLESASVINDIKEIIAAPAPLASLNQSIYLDQFNLYNKLKEIILR